VVGECKSVNGAAFPLLNSSAPQLPALLVRQPHMHVELYVMGFVPNELQGHFLRAAAAYASVWHQIKDLLVKSLTASTGAQGKFFVMRYQPPLDEDTGREMPDEPALTGILSFASVGEGFGARITEEDQSTGEERSTVYDQTVDIPAA
jgi:hypothetical protein